MVCWPKFYIHGGDKWLELDDDGRFENWGRAKFAFIKRGKVRIAKTKAVLTALQDFRAGLKTAIRDGARLPHKKIISSKVIRHTEVKITNTIINQTTRSDVAIQTTPLPLRSKQLLLSDSMSSIENIPRQITTTAMITPIPNKLTLKKNWMVKTVTENVTPKNIQNIKLQKEDSSKYDLYKRKRSGSSDSIVWVVLPKNGQNPIETEKCNNETNQKASKSEQRKRCRSSSSSGSKTPPRKIVKRTKSVSDLPSIKQRIKSIESVKGFEGKNSKKPVRCDNHSDENTLRHNAERGTFHKELLITEEDIEVLRYYLIRNGSDFDLLRFDQDDRYKQQLFSKINPLVSLVRCSNIAQMLKSNIRKLRLKDLTSKLGPALIADTPKPKKYKMKNQNFIHESDNDTDKENSKKTRNNKHEHRSNKISTHTSNRYSTETESDSDVEHRYQGNKSRTSGRHLRKSVGNKVNQTKTSSIKTHVKNAVETDTDSDFVDGKKSDKKEHVQTSRRVLRKSVGHTKRTNHKDEKGKISSQDSSDEYSEVEHRTDKKKTVNRKNDEKPISLPETTDSESATAESSVEEINGKVLRRKMTRNSNITRNSLRHSKTDNNNKQNKNIKSKEDKTKSNDDSDSDFEIKRIMRKTKSSGKITTDMESNNASTDESIKEINKTTRTLNKATQTDSDSDAEVKTIKTRLSLNKNNPQHKKDNKQNKRENEQNKKGNEQNKKDNEQNEKDNEQNKKDNVKPSRKSLVKTKESGNNKTKENLRNLIRNRKGNSTDEEPELNTDRNKTISEDEFKSAKERDYKQRTKGKQTSQLNYKHSDHKKQTSIKSKPTPNKIKNIADNAKKDDLIDPLPEKHLNSPLIFRTPLKNKLNRTATSEDLNKNHNSVNMVSTRATTKDTTPVVIEPREPFERSASSSSVARQSYSSLEDQAIVSWVCTGPRARRVNGNAMWKELEESYYNITAQHRSWHSLRNRYLRSILPRLPRLALDPSTVKRLRAAAATGEIKGRSRAEPYAAYDAKMARFQRASSEDSEPPRKTRRLSLALTSPPARVTRSSIGNTRTRQT